MGRPRHGRGVRARAARAARVRQSADAAAGRGVRRRGPAHALSDHPRGMPLCRRCRRVSLHRETPLHRRVERHGAHSRPRAVLCGQRGRARPGSPDAPPGPALACDPALRGRAGQGCVHGVRPRAAGRLVRPRASPEHSPVGLRLEPAALGGGRATTALARRAAARGHAVARAGDGRVSRRWRQSPLAHGGERAVLGVVAAFDRRRVRLPPPLGRPARGQAGRAPAGVSRRRHGALALGRREALSLHRGRAAPRLPRGLSLGGPRSAGAVWPTAGRHAARSVGPARQVAGRGRVGRGSARRAHPSVQAAMTSNGRPIRVLMLTCAWPPPDRPGYTTTFIRRQVEFLQAAGVAVDVFHFSSFIPPAYYLRAWIVARRRTTLDLYALLHAQFGQSGLVALPKRLPLVVTFRGDDLQGIVGRNLRITPAGKVLQTLSRIVARAADACIVVSEHMKAFLPRSVTAHVIPSGLDLDQFRPIPREEARARLGLPLDKRLVLFVGNPAVERKRYPLAREAVDILKRSLPADLVVAWSVRHRDVPVWMNACDALVFTSMQEGSPNAVKEALACDLPVVSVPVGDVAQRIGGVAGCELCPDERPESIAAVLERVLRRGIRAAGRPAVQDLDERRLAQQVIDVYRSVLGARNGGPAVAAERRPPVAAARGAP